MSFAVRAALLLTLFAASACQSYDPPEWTPEESRERTIDDALATWEETFGPAPECHVERAAVRVYALSAVGYEQQCPAESVACFKLMHVTPSIFTDEHTLWVRHSYEGMVMHESMHWLQVCSGRNGDHGNLHDDAAVWDILAPRYLDATR